MLNKNKIRLTLVRHGETEDNVLEILSGHRETQLTEKGLWQAQKIKERLLRDYFDTIYCSDLVRAKHTITPYLEAKGHSAHFTPFLRERNIGIFAGSPRKILLDAQNEVSIDKFKPEKGESLEEVRERARLFLGTLLHLHDDESILVCSHGIFLSLLLTSLLKKDIEEYKDLIIDNTGLTIVEITNKNRVELIKFNCTEHLV